MSRRAQSTQSKQSDPRGVRNEPAPAWRPITTAPTGTYVLAWFARAKSYAIVRRLGDGAWVDEDDSTYRVPSKWRHLPDPPK
jgi:hypothetical protein